MIKLWMLFAFILILFFSSFSLALALSPPVKNDQPIHVVADRLEVDNKTQVANFIGAVKAIQGDVTITSNILEVYYDRETSGKSIHRLETEQGKSLIDNGGQIRKVVAIGHVKIVQKDRLGVGQKATYWAGGRKMLLEGQATIWRGQNQLSGEHIIVFLDDDRSIVRSSPGKRVAVTIMPEQKKDAGELTLTLN